MFPVEAPRVRARLPCMLSLFLLSLNIERSHDGAFACPGSAPQSLTRQRV
jgi:hypothetical protein